MAMARWCWRLGWEWATTIPARFNINGGILKMNGALSLGATNGGTTVASGATLDLNGQTPNAEPMVLQGAGSAAPMARLIIPAASANLSGGPRKITLSR